MKGDLVSLNSHLNCYQIEIQNMSLRDAFQLIEKIKSRFEKKKMDKRTGYDYRIENNLLIGIEFLCIR